MNTTEATKAILFCLLESHERSSSYGKPGPWPRDVIVRFDAKSFPDAFSPHGREQRAALIDAARELANSGALRIVEHRGPAAGEISELRLGADEVARAEAIARSHDFSPLRDAFALLTSTASRLRAEESPAWLRERLEQIEAQARNAELTTLGIGRERFKRDQRDVVDALRAAHSLWRGVNGWERVVSERVFGDSKRIAAIRGELRRTIARLDPRFESIDEDVGDVLEVCGLRRKPGVIHCAGSASIKLGARVYELADFTPVAQLPEAWTAPLVAAVKDEVDVVTTIENEVPYVAYVEERGGPAGLGASRELAVYSGGFPTPALTSFLRQLAEVKPGMRFRHWGDADLGGLRIWLFLRQKIGAPLEIFRTTPEWIEENEEGARTMKREERGALARLRDQLAELDPDAFAVAAALLRIGKKIEQERWATTR